MYIYSIKIRHKFLPRENLPGKKESTVHKTVDSL